MAERVHLVPLERAHGPLIRNWLLDDDLRERLGTIRPPSEYEQDVWMERQAMDSNSHVRVIAGSYGPVGLCGLVDVDLLYRNAETWLYIAAGRRVGVGRQAVSLMLGYAFETLGLHRVRARVFGFNEEALAFFPQCGFVAEGVERDAVFKRGAFHDVHLFGILAHEQPMT